MRHFLARILNCAVLLAAALPAILVPSGLSDVAVILSSGREPPRVLGHSLPEERNDIFSPGAEPDLIVDRASMSFGAEPVEVAPSSPGSTVASFDPEQSGGW